MLKLVFIVGVIASSIAPFKANAQSAAMPNRVNLEDIKIEGEASSQSIFASHNRSDLDERIKIRHDFRREIEESIPPAFDTMPQALLNP